MKWLARFILLLAPVFAFGAAAPKTEKSNLKTEKDFVKVLERRGARHRYIRVEGAPHTFLIESKYGDFRKTILDFFRDSMK